MNIFHEDDRGALLVGDCREQLDAMPAGFARTCVTSPPYWGLRDYGVDGQIGLEQTPQEYVEQIVEVFRAVRRVLADDGTLWLNLGDSYAMSTKGSSGKGAKQVTNAGTILEDRRWKIPDGLKAKDLVGIPWMVAFALRADGWYLRSDIIWHKPNPMPESVTDRPTKSHEHVFLFSKSERYYYDQGAIREPFADDRKGASGAKRLPYTEGCAGKRHDYISDGSAPGLGRAPDHQRNKRDVWTIAPTPYKGAHFATMPVALAETCVLAGSAPGDVVVDPFCGAGTTGLAAHKHGRSFVGTELNPEYAALAVERWKGAP